MNMVLFATAAAFGVWQADGSAGWYVTDGPVRSLAFGERGADHAAISIQCRRGQAVIHVEGLYTGDGPEPRRVQVIGGRSSATLPLRYDSDPGLGGGHRVDVPLSAAPMRAFARSGSLAFDVANGKVVGDATSARERSAIASFLNRCR